MNDFSLLRIRNLILAAYSVGDNGILSLDITKASLSCFIIDEIEEANKILAAEHAECQQGYIKK